MTLNLSTSNNTKLMNVAMFVSLYSFFMICLFSQIRLYSSQKIDSVASQEIYILLPVWNLSEIEWGEYIHTYIHIYIYMYMYIYTEEKILALFSGWRWPASIVWPFALKLYSLNSTFFQSPLSYTKHHKKMPPRLQCIQKQNTNNCLSKIEPRCKHFKLDEWHHTAGFHSVVWSSLAQTTQ